MTKTKMTKMREVRGHIGDNEDKARRMVTPTHGGSVRMATHDTDDSDDEEGIGGAVATLALNRGGARTIMRPRNIYDEENDRRRMRQITLTYKDVESALLTFSGDGTQNVIYIVRGNS